MQASASDVLKDFLSRDRVRIHVAIGAVLDMSDGSDLAMLAARRVDISRSVDGVDLKGAFMSNRVHFDHAMARLDLYANRLAGGNLAQTCYCQLLRGTLFTRPERIEARGRILINNKTVFREEYHTDYDVTCTDCEALLCAREQVAWHMPTYDWVEVTPSPRI